jgi:uncharacterized membrane-anchored protein YhcB (DUF1043 family)
MSEESFDYKYLIIILLVLVIIGLIFYFLVVPKYKEHIENNIAKEQMNTFKVYWLDLENKTTQITVDNLCVGYSRLLQQAQQRGT